METSRNCPALLGLRSCTLALVFVLIMAAGVFGGRPTYSADLAGGATCRPAYPQRGSSCSKDSQCCTGLICQSGACRPGCRIGGTSYASGATNPSNACQSCQPSVSTTSWSSAADGSSCNDGNACTQIDTCRSGSCRGANPVACTAQDQCHDAGTCNPSTGLCSNPQKTNGTSCNDGNACTRTDACQTGVCRGSNPVACTAQDACHSVGTCDTATGVCSNPAKANGSSCNDGNACTRRDTCQAGTCTGSNPVICQSSDQCLDPGTCDPATGSCSSPNKPDGTPCSDGNACTTGDRCQSGACVGPAPIICISPDACHDGGACDPRTGACPFPAKPNGTPCNDGTACTTVDSCQNGTCTGSSPVTCAPAPDQCHLDGACDPATGACTNPAKPDGTACSDGNACTLSDRCLAGVCTPLAQSVCISFDPCYDSGPCDPATGQCARTPRPDGTACNDGNACTSLDMCQGGVCTGAGPVICLGPPDGCHDAGSCNPATGQCEYPQKPNGTVCGDGNGCTVGDTCQNGACTGSVVICPAGLPSGCYSAANDCNPADGRCYPRPGLNGTACDDGNACTSGDSCHQGICVGNTCAAGQVCCGLTGSGSESCTDLGNDSANCGACGHACVNSACLRGQCYDGCVIGGAGYADGTRNPANDCQICDVGLSRTSWVALGTDPHTPNNPTCHVGCFSGFCFSGACGTLGGNGGCQSSTCAASSCTNGSCVATPINEGATCVPQLSTNACKSSSVGTCQSGDCVPNNTNEGGFCVPTGPVYGTQHECRSLEAGTCHLGHCDNSALPNGIVCHQVDSGDGLCIRGTCSNGDCPSVSPVNCDVAHDYCGNDGTCDNATGQCVFPQQNPPPSGGSIECNRTGEFGPDPSKCCADQVCICAPTPTGIPNFCLSYGCWTPSDIPHGYP